MVGEGQEEVDKCLMIKEKCPKLKRMIWDDPKGMRGYDDPILISLKEVMKLGKGAGKKGAGPLRGDDHRRGKETMSASSSILPEQPPFPKGPSSPTTIC